MSSHARDAANTIPFAFLYDRVSDDSPESVWSLKEYWKHDLGVEDIPAMDDHGNTLLHLLAGHGNAKAISGLLEDGLLRKEQLQVGNKRGDTPLHQAAKFGMKNVADVLILAAGEGICLARNSWGETPIYVAAAYGWEEIFHSLKRIKSDDDDDDHNTGQLGRKNGWTILHADILASKPDTFRSSSEYAFINLGSGTFIPLLSML